LADYEKRLRRLEEKSNAARVPTLHILHTIVDPALGVVGAFAEGRSFDREEGESEKDLCNRVETCLGWATQADETTNAGLRSQAETVGISHRRHC